MKMICPKCRAEVTAVLLLSHPPKSQNKCYLCGWNGEIRETAPDKGTIFAS